jgi:hypothetical protein
MQTESSAVCRNCVGRNKKRPEDKSDNGLSPGRLIKVVFYWTSRSSTSKINVAPGGIVPLPLSP